jgi:CBS domain-containing protein
MSTVAKIMSNIQNRRAVGIDRECGEEDAAARSRSLLVKKGKQLVGIVTDTDIVRRAVATSKPLGKLTVDKIMTTPLCTIEGSQPVDDAQEMMGDLGVRHLAVTKGGAIVGVVSVRDVMLSYRKYAQSQISAEVSYSEPKIGQD